LPLLVAVALGSHAVGQSTAFEVASVKPSPPAPVNRFGFPPRPTVRVDPSGFTATQVTLRELTRRAYGVLDAQIVGGPAWLASERFDVMAKTSAGRPAGADQIAAMLQSLLADRFHLRVHMETREMPVFRLLVVRRGGAASDGLRRSDIDCPALRRLSNASTGDISKPECGITYRMEGGIMTVSIRGEPLRELMRALETETRRPVLDQTNLSGTFDGTLSFVPEPLPGFPPLPPGQQANGESAFTALQEQLGLRLEAARGSADVLVIDSAERANEN
jgi:uncharacterized protein (TIGR03435 family)